MENSQFKHIHPPLSKKQTNILIEGVGNQKFSTNDKLNFAYLVYCVCTFSGICSGLWEMQTTKLL